MAECKYNRVLLKLSGESFCLPGEFGINGPALEALAERIDEISVLISKETGKPPLEALSSEVYGAMDSTFYYYTIAEQVLDKKEDIDLGFYNSLDKTSFLVYKPGIEQALFYPFSRLIPSR